MIKIVHIITGLGSGGAENMLYKLLKHSDENTYYHEVISLMDEGIMGEKIKSQGIKIHSLNLNRKNLIKSLLKARRICKNFDIVNTWLYHADVFGFVVSKMLLKKKLIWNIRHSNLDKNVNKSRTIKIVKMNSILSKMVDCITYNSNKALETHQEVGYYNKKSIVISNGFELDQFKFDKIKREKIRKEILLSSHDKVLITVGRWSIQKDYLTLIKALNELKKQNVKFKMIMVGNKLDYSNEELMNLIKDYDLEEDILLIGRRLDVSDLLSAADIYVSSSLGESFSNSIGEAMACELPCIVTDVGDSKQIVGDSGIVVDAKDYISMSKGLFNYTKNSNSIRNKEGRLRVIDNYDIKKVVKIFEKEIMEIIQ